MIRKFFAEIETIPPVLQGAYYPSLNGIRGIAIIMVVFEHLKLSYNPFYTTVLNGQLGVVIFFVLSGFLITTLSLKEKAITKTISLKKFYIRRALRILPVAYLYLVVIIVLNLIYKLQISYINLLGAAFFVMDISSFFRKYYSTWDTGHFWSLAVEEQFYLFFPFLLKKQFNIYLSLILFIVFVLPIIICLQYLFPLLNSSVLYAGTHLLIKFQPIAVGCLFAVALFKYPFLQVSASKNKVLLNILAILAMLLIQYNNFFSLQSMFEALFISFLAGYIIISNLSPATDIVFKLLNSNALSIIGILSYSIYIWQQLFTSYDERLSKFIVNKPYNIIWIIAVSAISYYFYESYFLRLKKRFTKVKSNPTPPVLGT